VKRKFFAFLTLALCCIAVNAREQWTPEQANEWQKKMPYLAGVNYVPSTAINAIEIWSKETFDAKTIDHELGLLKSIGMNTVRIFLSDIVWRHDAEGMYERMSQFLDLCEKHDVYVMFTFFTNGGRPDGKYGKQMEPIPGKHNPGWVKTPTLAVLADDENWDKNLKGYVNGIVSKFANHKRVAVWDIYNEPGKVSSAHVPGQKKMTKDEHINYMIKTKKLMEKAFVWAREANPSQPLTACVWESGNIVKEMFDDCSLRNSDIITYHCYKGLNAHINFLAWLKSYNRPIMCTEWLARHCGSTFDPILEFLKENNVATYAFGLKAGKIQTELPWPWLLNPKVKGVEKIWFHDIFDRNDKPYSEEEVAYIKRILKNK